MLGDNLSNSVALCSLFQLSRYPRTFGASENVCDSWFIRLERSIIEVGCVLQMTCVSGGIQLHVQHLLGNDPALSSSRETRILNRMLQIKQHAWRVARIAFVHQHGTTAQKIAVPFQGKIEHRVKQGMARAYKSSERLAHGCYERLLEGDALISLQDRLTDTD